MPVRSRRTARVAIRCAVHPRTMTVYVVASSRFKLRSRNAVKISMKPRMSANPAIHAMSSTALPAKYPAAQKARRISAIPIRRPTHQSPLLGPLRAPVTSKMHLKSNTQANRDASATKVPDGLKKATIPAKTKSVPTMTRAIFHPVVELAIAMNSLTPAPIATTPNMIEMAETDVVLSRRTIRATQSQTMPVRRKIHQTRDAASAKSDSSSDNCGKVSLPGRGLRNPCTRSAEEYACARAGRLARAMGAPGRRVRRNGLDFVRNGYLRRRLGLCVGIGHLRNRERGYRNDPSDRHVSAHCAHPRALLRDRERDRAEHHRRADQSPHDR